MSVKIRLSRIGKKKAPFYRIIAVDSRKKRDGAFLEDLGTYDVLNSKLVRFDLERVNYWISQGALPSDSVKKIIKLFKESGLSGKIVLRQAPVYAKASTGRQDERKKEEKIAEKAVKKEAPKKKEASAPEVKEEAPKEEKKAKEA